MSVARIIVRDLGSHGDKGELNRLYSKYGPLKNVWVADNPPGFAYVFYHEMKDAQRAVTGTNGHIVCGCRVRVELSPIEEKRKYLTNRGSLSQSSRGRGSHSYGGREHDGYKRGSRFQQSPSPQRGSRFQQSPSPQRGSRFQQSPSPQRGSRFQQSPSPPPRRFISRSSHDEAPVVKYSRGRIGSYENEREYNRSVPSYRSGSDSYRGRGGRDSYHHQQRPRPPPPHPPPPPRDDYVSHSNTRQPIQRFSSGGGGRGRPSYETRSGRDHTTNQFRHRTSRGEEFNVRRNSYEENRSQDVNYRSQRSSRFMGRGGMETSSYRGTSSQGRPYSHNRPTRGHGFGGQNRNGWSGDFRGRSVQSRRRYGEGDRQRGERTYRGRNERKDHTFVRRHSPHALVMYSSEDSPPYADDDRGSPCTSPPLAFSRTEKNYIGGQDRERYQEECYRRPPPHHRSRSRSPREMVKEGSTPKYLPVDDRYPGEIPRENFGFEQGPQRYETEEVAYMPIEEAKEEGREPLYVNSPTNHHYFKEHEIAVYSSPGREIERQVIVVPHTPDRESRSRSGTPTLMD